MTTSITNKTIFRAATGLAMALATAAAILATTTEAEAGIATAIGGKVLKAEMKTGAKSVAKTAVKEGVESGVKKTLKEKALDICSKQMLKKAIREDAKEALAKKLGEEVEKQFLRYAQRITIDDFKKRTGSNSLYVRQMRERKSDYNAMLRASRK